MKLHELELLERFAKERKNGIKLFEIRKNDSNFEVGDLVKYKIVEHDIETCPPQVGLTRDSLNKDLVDYFDTRLFKIRYVTNYEKEDGYVVLFIDGPCYIGD